MRTLRFILQKEFKQIFRNPAIIRIIFIMPVMQLLILPWAADYEIKNIRLAVVDEDHSEYARQLIHKITSSGYFQLQDYTGSYKRALHWVEHDDADVILQIPPHFEKDLVTEDQSTLFLAINAINGVKASLGGAYLQMIIRDYNQQIRSE